MNNNKHNDLIVFNIYLKIKFIYKLLYNINISLTDHFFKDLDLSADKDEDFKIN
jgi:hypothetical protein